MCINVMSYLLECLVYCELPALSTEFSTASDVVEAESRPHSEDIV